MIFGSKKLGELFEKAKNAVAPVLDAVGIGASMGSCEEDIAKFDNSETKQNVDATSAVFEIKKMEVKGGNSADEPERWEIINYYGPISPKIIVPNRVDGKDVYSVAAGAFKKCDKSTAVFCEGIKEIRCIDFAQVVLPDSLEKLIATLKVKTGTVIVPKHTKQVSIGREKGSIMNLPDFLSRVIILGPVEFVGIGSFLNVELFIENCAERLDLLTGDYFEYSGYTRSSVKNLRNMPNIRIKLPETGKLKYLKADICNMAVSEINFPEGIEKIDGFEGKFRNCYKLKSVVLPSTLKEIVKDCFNGCDSIKSVVISGGLKKIPEDTFRWCEGLKSVKILNGVEEIEKNAFGSIKDLFIEIPPSVTKIDKESFGSQSDRTFYKYKLLIRCVTGTEAHRFAVRNEYDWEPMNP